MQTRVILHHGPVGLQIVPCEVCGCAILTDLLSNEFALEYLIACAFLNKVSERRWRVTDRNSVICMLCDSLSRSTFNIFCAHELASVGAARISVPREFQRRYGSYGTEKAILEMELEDVVEALSDIPPEN